MLERSFKQWGLMAVLPVGSPGAGGKARISARMLRKSVGQLAGIEQPRFNFTDAHYANAQYSLDDYLSRLALTKGNAAGFADGELSFGALAQVLTPARDVTEISLPSDVVKFAVSHSGRIKCASGTPIAESEDLSAPVASKQKVVFDPATVLSYWPRSGAFDQMKSGLVGGHLRIANVGAFTADGRSAADGGGGGGQGFELVALADASFHAIKARDGRSPGINYSPAVYVRVREQTLVPSTPSHSEFRYWRASNSSLQNVSATEFYTNLEVRSPKLTVAFSHSSYI